VAAAAVVHLAAWLALAPITRPDAGLLGPAQDAAMPVMTVQLVRAPDRRGSAAAPSPDRPSPRTAPVLEAAAASPPEQAPPAGPPPSPPPTDDDSLFQVPFRDAVAQARAELRAGLGCAHVDLLELPRSVLDLCVDAAVPRSTP
jgi:hypothetical protein